MGKLYSELQVKELRDALTDMLKEADDLMDFCIDREYLDPLDDSIEGIKSFNESKQKAILALKNAPLE